MTTTVDEKRHFGREIPDAVSYAVGHRVRVELLAALNDLGSASAIELARIVRQPLSTVTHHIGQLLAAGSIRVERTEKVRSVEQRFYSAIDPLYVNEEEMAEMGEEERREIAGLTLQQLVAEAFSSFWAGHLTSDPQVCISWSWFNVDEQGRADIAEEQLRSWKRFQEIERESQARCEASGDGFVSVFTASLGAKRARTAERPPNAPVVR
ncbi:MAG TPA: helix-turn-helix domain-containing protein [Solirubrobacterales bacterium]|jgi:DNA-binding transcriptional ArsR family regulator|nr:helix-turn-helix domain-containing protein [Solirubrobacterales bacterium]